MGPFSHEELERKIRNQEISRETQIHRLGESKWMPISSFEIFESILKEKVSSRIPHPEDDPIWVVLVEGEDGAYRQVGPLSRDDIYEKVHKGEIQFSDHVWKKGFSEWKKLTDLEELFPHTDEEKKEKLNLNEDEEPILESVMTFSPKEISFEETVGVDEENLASEFGRPVEWEVVERDLEIEEPKLESKEIDFDLDESSKDKKESILEESSISQENFPKPSSRVQSQFLQNLIVGAGVIIIFVATLAWLFGDKSEEQKVSQVVQKEISLTHSHSGKELDFFAPRHPMQNLNIRVESVKGKVLSKNSFEKVIRIELDKKGRTKVRLDQWAPQDGYYKVRARVGKASLERQIFIGPSKKNFEVRLSEFKSEMASPVVVPAPPQNKIKVPKELQVTYQLARELEKGFSNSKSNPMAWRGFYQGWLKRYYGEGQNPLALKNTELESTGITKKHHSLIEQLEVVSGRMDQQIRFKGSQIRNIQLSISANKLIEEYKSLY